MATAVVTWAMLRTWPVRLDAIELTLSVRSRQVPATPVHLRLAAELALGAHLAGHPGHLVGERRQLVHHRVDGVLQLQDLAPRVDGDLLRQVALGHRRGDLGDVADLAGQVRRHASSRCRSGPARCRPRPRTCAWPPSLPSVPTSRATRVTSSANDDSWSTIVLTVIFSSRISPAGVHGDLLRQVALRHRRGHLGDVAHLAGQVGRHVVHVVGQVPPGAGDALHLRLTAELALGAHLAGHPGHLVGERRQLVHHRVDGVLQLQDLARGRPR